MTYFYIFWYKIYSFKFLLPLYNLHMLYGHLYVRVAKYYFSSKATFLLVLILSPYIYLSISISLCISIYLWISPLFCLSLSISLQNLFVSSSFSNLSSCLVFFHLLHIFKFNSVQFNILKLNSNRFCYFRKRKKVILYFRLKWNLMCYETYIILS